VNLTGYQIQSCLSKFLTESVREFPHSLLFSSHYVNKNCHKSDPEDKCIDSATPLTNIKQIMTGQLGNLQAKSSPHSPNLGLLDIYNSTCPSSCDSYHIQPSSHATVWHWNDGNEEAAPNKFDSFNNRANTGEFIVHTYSLNSQLNLLEDLEGSRVRATHHRGPYPHQSRHRTKGGRQHYETGRCSFQKLHDKYPNRVAPRRRAGDFDFV
jgi:hypothetical protein